MSSPEFLCFPRETIRFLTDLGENNNKPWFEANRSAYETALLQPAVAFVETLGPALKNRYPAVQYDTRTNGSGTLMRIYRDTRFSQDKTPYKTNISGLFWEGSGRKAACPAFGFQLTSEGLGLMAGLFGFDKNQLARYREAVLDEVLGGELVEAVGAVTTAGPYLVAGKEYKRVPAGFDPDHPRAEWLQYKGLWVHTPHPLPVAQVCEPGLVDLVLDHFQRLAPVQRWLVSAGIGQG